MKNHLLPLAAWACVALGAQGADLYWHFTKSGTNYAPWSYAENWTNALGEAQAPAAGDALHFVNIAAYSGNIQTPHPNLGASKPVDFVEVDTSAVNFQQGTLHWQAGGRGLKVRQPSMSHWGDNNIVGTGEVPIDIASGITYSMQKSMTGVNGIYVKRGLGTLAGGPDNRGYNSNTYSNLIVEQGLFTFRIPGPDAFSAKFPLAFRGDDATARFGLASGNRWVKNLDYTEIDVTTTYHGFTDGASKTNVFLHVTGTPARDVTRFTGTFYGRFGLVWTPTAKTATDGFYVFECAKAQSATTGDFTVTNGVLRLTEGAALTQASSVTVRKDGTFALTETAGTTHLGALVVDAGGTVALAGNKILAVDGLTVAGVPLAGKRFYRAADGATWISGTGAVFVSGPVAKASEAVWTGAAATTALTEDANWEGETAPSFAQDDTRATFATGGAAAQAAGFLAQGFWGLAFDGSRDFALTAADDTAIVYLGAGGVTTTAGAAGRTYTFGWPLYLTAGQTWNVAAGDTLVQAAPIANGTTAPLVLDGAGTYELRGTNTFMNELWVTSGVVHVYNGAAFGATNGLTRLNVDKARLVFHNVTVNESFKRFSCKKQIAQGFETPEATTNVFNGEIDLRDGTDSSYLKIGAGGVAYVRGGFLNNGNTGISGSGTMIVENVPLKFNDRVSAGAGSTLDLRVKDNLLGCNHYLMHGSRLVTRVPYALRHDSDASIGRTMLSMGDGCADTWDMCGCDQSVAEIIGWKSGTGLITSEEPATLRVCQTYNRSSGNWAYYARTNYVTFAGAVSLVYEGTLDFALMRDQSATGTVTVANGKLAFPADGGSWPNATNVVVRGGTLALGRSDVFAKTADLFLRSDAGTLELAGGVLQRVRYLYIDGVRQRCGAWGRTGHATARHTCARLAGDGTLVVRGIPGSTLVVR